MTAEQVESIRKELSLWKPQELSLRKLDATLRTVDFDEDAEYIASSIPGQIEFDTSFPSFTFALATGTGKTRLLGASVAYLYRERGLENFFIITPNQTIYEQFKRKLQQSNSQYLFQGLSPFPTPQVITGDDYHWRPPDDDRLTVYLFNIQKIFNPRSDVEFKFHRYREELGGSYANILRNKDDLVVLLDESHRYRGPESQAAIENLSPCLGLEYTATPVYNDNIIVRYGLKDAIKDGLIKRVRAVYRENDATHSEELEEIKLRDGLRRHLDKKATLSAYTENNDLPDITPIAFINTYRGDRSRPIEHAEEIRKRIDNPEFMGGVFEGKTLVIHSESEEEEERKLLQLEDPENPYEVVIHVNKLREGWDVRNIFTIIPLRPSVSMVLTQQTIGRGVRLPFGSRRPDVDNDGKFESYDQEEVFTLDVICYQQGGDNYRKIIEAARDLDIPISSKDAAEDEEAEDVGTVQVSPIGESANEVSIPRVVGDAQGDIRIEAFSPSVRASFQEDPVLKGVDVSDVSQAPETVGEAAVPDAEDQLGFLVGRLITEIDELSTGDIPSVQRICTEYLNAVEEVGANQSVKNQFIAKYHALIYEDIRDQLKEHIGEEVTVDHKVLADSVEFEPFTAVVERKRPEVPWYDLDEEDGVEKTVVTGYSKTCFPKTTFDSYPEKVFADVVNKSESVERWVRVPRGQFTILTRHGRYSPDFVVETDKNKIIVEIKGEDRIVEGGNVLEKARDAREWCQTVSSDAQAGKPWRYCLVPASEVSNDRSLERIVASGVGLRDDSGSDDQ